MSARGAGHFHTVDEEWLAEYSAGGLSQAKRLLLTCQAALNPALAARLRELDGVGGSLLESAKGETLSDGFMSRLFGRIDGGDLPDVLTRDEPDSVNEPSWSPGPLREFCDAANIPLVWKKLGFGMERIPLGREGHEKLYLLKSRAGMKMPHHTHKGEEWALILQGGYHVGNTGFIRGDLHREDETCAHQPLIDDHGEDCITLVAAEGGLSFTNPVLNIFKPLMGV